MEMFWKHFIFLTLVVVCVAHRGRSSGRSCHKPSQKSSNSRPVINIDSSLIEKPLAIFGSFLERIVRPSDHDKKENKYERTKVEDKYKKSNRKKVIINNEPDYSESEEDIPPPRPANTNRINRNQNIQNNQPDYSDSEEDIPTHRPANTNVRRNINNDETTNRNQNTRNNPTDYSDSEEDIPPQTSNKKDELKKIIREKIEKKKNSNKAEDIERKHETIENKKNSLKSLPESKTPKEDDTLRKAHWYKPFTYDSAYEMYDYNDID